MTFPIELLLKIFEKVDFINLIKLRSICKNWKYIIDNFRIIKQMTIDETIHTQDKIDNVIYLNGFQICSQHMFKKIIGSNVLHDLKYLNYLVNYEFGDKNKLIHLNCFKLLQRLALEISSDEEEIELVLVHPNIKWLSVLTDLNQNDDGFSMEINCPQCEKLEINHDSDLSDFDIVYPKKVKILELTSNNYDDPELEFYDEIDKFMNVEQLKMEIGRFFNGDEMSTQISKLSKLKKIEIEFVFQFEFMIIDTPTTYSLKNTRDLLYDLIDLFSEKGVLIFLENEQMKSKKQVKKLIDNKIGESLSFLIWKETHPDYDIDDFSDSDNSDDIDDSEDADDSDNIDDSEDADNTDNIDDSEDADNNDNIDDSENADDSDDLNESPEVILIDSDD